MLVSRDENTTATHGDRTLLSRSRKVDRKPRKCLRLSFRGTGAAFCRSLGTGKRGNRLRVRGFPTRPRLGVRRGLQGCGVISGQKLVDCDDVHQGFRNERADLDKLGQLGTVRTTL